MKNQQILQTKKWVQDRDAKSCKKCQTKFKMIFKRKHHCRNCGELFCDSCSNFFMDKTNFKTFRKSKQNIVRLCQNCYIDINKKLREIVEDKNSLNILNSQQMRRHSKSFNVINEKLPESQIYIQRYQLLQFYNQYLKLYNHLIKQEIIWNKNNKNQKRE